MYLNKAAGVFLIIHKWSTCERSSDKIMYNHHYKGLRSIYIKNEEFCLGNNFRNLMNFTNLYWIIYV